MSNHSTTSGVAALTICEALLLALNDAGVLPESEIKGVLKDAASTHENAGNSGAGAYDHQAVAALINRIVAGGDAHRRP